MKKTIFFKTLLIAFCCISIFSCSKNSPLVIPPLPPVIPVLPATTETSFTNFSDADWKGVVWTPYNGDWTSNGANSDGTDIVAAGIKWDRYWFQANAAPDNMDAIIRLHDAKGIKMIACYVKSFPSMDLGTSSQQATEINALRAWVARYKNSIHYWEIGNETNSTTYWNLGAGQGSTDPTTPYNMGVHNYVQWLKLANEAIKSMDASAIVILGGISEYYMEPYMDRLTADSAFKFCDEIAYHPYAENSNPVPNLSVNRLIAFKNKMTSWPAPKNNMPIWITEIGFHVGSISSPGKVADEATKAAYLQETYTKFMQTLTWKRPICWYNLQEATPGLNYYNLISRSSDTGPATYYPAYTTYKGMNPSWDYWVAGIAGTTTISEAEDLAVAANSGDVVTIFSESAASNGKGSKYASDAAGDSIVYSLPLMVPGSYQVTIGVKKSTTRGIFQLAVQPTGGTPYVNIGSPQDQYAGIAAYAEINMGIMTVTNTSYQSFKFKVTGKNAASTGYDLAFDYIKLVRQ